MHHGEIWSKKKQERTRSIETNTRKYKERNWENFENRSNREKRSRSRRRAVEEEEEEEELKP